MAKSSKPDKGNQRKTETGKGGRSEKTQPLPHLRKVLDEHFVNWPGEDDNDAAGGGK